MYGFQKTVVSSSVIALVLWLSVSTWFLIRYQESQAVRESHNSYRQMLAGIEEDFSRKYIIISGKKRVGTANIRITTQPDGSTIVSNNIDAVFKLFKLNAAYTIDAKIYITKAYNLDHIDIRLNFADSSYKIIGKIREDDDVQLLDIELFADDALMTNMAIPAPDGLNISDMLMPIIKTGKPIPGKTWTTQTIDPFSGKLTEMVSKISDPGNVPGSNGLISGYPITTTYGNHTIETFVDSEGDVLWEQVPYGFTLVREDVADIMFPIQ